MVSTHLKNISQNGNLPQVGVKIKNLWNHHPATPIDGIGTLKFWDSLKAIDIFYPWIKATGYGEEPYVYPPNNESMSHLGKRKKSSSQEAIFTITKSDIFHVVCPSPLVQPLYQSARLTLKPGETLPSFEFWWDSLQCGRNLQCKISSLNMFEYSQQVDTKSSHK